MVEIMTCYSFTNKIIKIMVPCMSIIKKKKKSYFEFLLIENKTQI